MKKSKKIIAALLVIATIAAAAFYGLANDPPPFDEEAELLQVLLDFGLDNTSANALLEPIMAYEIAGFSQLYDAVFEAGYGSEEGFEEDAEAVVQTFVRLLLVAKEWQIFQIAQLFVADDEDLLEFLYAITDIEDEEELDEAVEFTFNYVRLYTTVVTDGLRDDILNTLTRESKGLFCDELIIEVYFFYFNNLEEFLDSGSRSSSLNLANIRLPNNIPNSLRSLSEAVIDAVSDARNDPNGFLASSFDTAMREVNKAFADCPGGVIIVPPGGGTPTPTCTGTVPGTTTPPAKAMALSRNSIRYHCNVQTCPCKPEDPDRYAAGTVIEINGQVVNMTMYTDASKTTVANTVTYYRGRKWGSQDPWVFLHSGNFSTATSGSLNVPDITQNPKKNWCWAASSLMVSRKFNSSCLTPDPDENNRTALERIVYKYTGSYTNDVTSDKHKDVIDWLCGQKYAYALEPKISDALLKAHIDAGNPVILFRESSTGLHATVVYEYTTSSGTRTYKVRDSLLDDGYRSWTYDQIAPSSGYKLDGCLMKKQ